MSATNSTSNYELPIFLATDKPAWLTDWNGAMNAIDTAIHAAQAAADGAQTTASTATADISTINASLTTITDNIQSLTTSVNSNTGAINTINSLIGNGEPTTTDKTLIGAINEIYGMITGGGGDEIEAANVAYDNTTSGLTADDVQSAIDEVVTMLPVGPVPSQYDFDITAHTGDATVTPAADITLDSITDRSKFRYLLNQDKSIGKLYGSYVATATNKSMIQGWNTIMTINAGLNPLSAPYNILLGSAMLYAGGVAGGSNSRMLFNTDGTVDIQAYFTSATTLTGDIVFYLPACIYFFSDMGD